MTNLLDEIDQDLRADRMKSAWQKLAPFVYALALLIVLGTAGWRFYDYRMERQAIEAGDAYYTALNEQETGSLAGLETLAQDGQGDYAVLAGLRLASQQQLNGNLQEAEASLKALQAGSLSPLLQDFVSLRLAYIYLQQNNDEALQALMEGKASPSESAYRFHFDEIKALEALAAKDYEAARQLFETIQYNTEVSPSLQQRAETAIAVIDSMTTQTGSGEPSNDTGAQTLSEDEELNETYE